MWSVGLADGARWADCLAVRRRVFIEEQRVPPELEVDGRDPDCWHWYGAADDVVVATARARLVEPGVAKVERVAVLSSHRGRGLGHRLMRAVESDLARWGNREAVLAAQRTAEAFYAARGYVAEGEPFMDAGLEHVRMRKRLSTSVTEEDAGDPSKTG